MRVPKASVSACSGGYRCRALLLKHVLCQIKKSFDISVRDILRQPVHGQVATRICTKRRAVTGSPELKAARNRLGTDASLLGGDGKLQSWHSWRARVEDQSALLRVGHQQRMPELHPCQLVSGGVHAVRSDEPEGPLGGKLRVEGLMHIGVGTLRLAPPDRLWAFSQNPGSVNGQRRPPTRRQTVASRPSVQVTSTSISRQAASAVGRGRGDVGCEGPRLVTAYGPIRAALTCTSQDAVPSVLDLTAQGFAPIGTTWTGRYRARTHALDSSNASVRCRQGAWGERVRCRRSVTATGCARGRVGDGRGGCAERPVGGATPRDVLLRSLRRKGSPVIRLGSACAPARRYQPHVRCSVRFSSSDNRACSV